MTGKDRIEAAFAHREADRVPCFEQAIASDVASAILGRRAYTGATMLHYEEAVAWMQGEEHHAAWEEQTYRDNIAIVRALDLDMIAPPWRQVRRPTSQPSEYEFLYGDPAGDWEIWRFDPHAGTFLCARRHAVRPPSPEPDDLEPGIAAAERQLELPWSPVEIPADNWTRRLREDCPDLMVPAPGALAIPLQPVWLLACALRPDLVARYLDVCCEQACRQAESWAALGFTVVWGGGDLADNHGPTYGPKVFRELVLPRVQRYVARLHELGLQYVYRTDGNLWPIADEFFRQSDIDGFGEIDYDAGMRIPDLQARYGDRVTFWGDVPCGSLLHRGTAAQVREFVARRLAVCRGRGGWILGSSNTLVPGTPPENVLAMVETAQQG